MTTHANGANRAGLTLIGLLLLAAAGGGLLDTLVTFLDQGLQVDAVVLNVCWEQRVESADERGNSHVGGTKSVRATAEEQYADSQVGGKVRSVRCLSISPSVQTAKVSERLQIASSGHDSGSRKCKDVDASSD